MDRKLAFVIQNSDELKNPIFCLAVMRQWMYEAGEDFVDYHDSIISHKDNKIRLIDWLLSKQYITQKDYDRVVKEKNHKYAQDLLLNCDEGLLMHGEGGFVALLKAYQLIAEYISEHEDVRQRFFDEICKNEYLCDCTEEEKPNCDCSPHYCDDNGNVLCACIYEIDLQIGTMTKEQWLDLQWNANISFTDEYNFLKEMTIREADELDYDSEHECKKCLKYRDDCDCV